MKITRPTWISVVIFAGNGKHQEAQWLTHQVRGCWTRVTRHDFAGGVVVKANVRGGNECGADARYRAGMLEKKQNVFDDFIAAAGGCNPVLLRVETKAGHGLGKPTVKSIEELADIFAFLWRELGVGEGDG